GLPAAGATDIWKALQEAMKGEGVDTIVLLSDGAPTAGPDGYRDPRAIRRAIRKQNRSRMIVFHVIAIGHRAPHFAAMARHSGGTYVER
ncbi:MAG: hypothetical protein ACE5JG_04735, partial [Planctomycetota bacterium]